VQKNGAIHDSLSSDRGQAGQTKRSSPPQDPDHPDHCRPTPLKNQSEGARSRHPAPRDAGVLMANHYMTLASSRSRELCLMQYEPERGVPFSHKIKPGADPGFFGGQRWAGISGTESGRGVKLGESDPAPARLRATEAEWAGAGAALSGKDDGIEPGTDHGSDHGLRGRRGGEGEALPKTSHRAAGG
jgi:hypothetical protein